ARWSRADDRTRTPSGGSPRGSPVGRPRSPRCSRARLLRCARSAPHARSSGPAGTAAYFFFVTLRVIFPATSCTEPLAFCSEPLASSLRFLVTRPTSFFTLPTALFFFPFACILLPAIVSPPSSSFDPGFPHVATVKRATRPLNGSGRGDRATGDVPLARCCRSRADRFQLRRQRAPVEQRHGGQECPDPQRDDPGQWPIRLTERGAEPEEQAQSERRDRPEPHGDERSEGEP